MPVTISKEAEDEANNYFQCIYNLTSQDSLTIDNVLEMLKQFKESSVKREKVITISNYLYFNILLLNTI